MPRRECMGSQGCVSEPPNVRSVSGAVETIGSNQAEVKKNASECRQPKTEGIEPGKCHVPRSDHQRDQIIGQTKNQRHGHKKNHGGPMHREHPVKDLRRNKVLVGRAELDADDRGLNSTDQKKNQGIKDIHDAEPLVINCCHPIVKPVYKRSDRCFRLLRFRPCNQISRHQTFSSCSTKCFHVRRNRVQIMLTQSHCGHETAWFKPPCSLNPQPKLFTLIRSYSDGYRLTSHLTGQIRTELSVSLAACYCMAVHAGGGFEDAPPFGNGLVHLCRLALLLYPAVKITA